MTRAEELLQLYEATVHRVISFLKGHRVVRKTCAPGYRKVGTHCKKMSSVERYHIRKGHRYAARKNRSHMSRIQRRRARSITRRISSGY